MNIQRLVELAGVKRIDPLRESFEPSVEDTEKSTLDNDFLETIARKHFGFSLKKTNSSKDFHEVSVWDLKSALLEVYDAGKNSNV